MKDILSKIPKDKADKFVRSFSKSKDVSVACKDSGLTPAQGFTLAAQLETFKENSNLDRSEFDGSKDSLLFTITNKLKDLEKEGKNHETYLKYAQEYSKLMGFYDDNADLGYLEDIQSLVDKIKEVFPEPIMKYIAYELEDIEERAGGVTNDEEEIIQIN